MQFLRLNETCRMIGYSLLLNDVNFVEIGFNPIRSGLFQKANNPGGGVGALKAPLPPPPQRFRKQLCQSSPYYSCAFHQVF